LKGQSMPAFFVAECKFGSGDLTPQAKSAHTRPKHLCPVGPPLQFAICNLKFAICNLPPSSHASTAPPHGWWTGRCAVEWSFPDSNHPPDAGFPTSSSLRNDSSMAVDPYQPCPCGSGKKIK